MAEAPPSGGGSPLKAITRKVGPLPLWAYAALVVVAYYLYTRYKGTSSTTSGSGSTTASTDASGTYVPPFDAASGGIGGGIGNTALPGTVNNYYYGDQGTVQANGGGTATTGASPPSTQPIITYGFQPPAAPGYQAPPPAGYTSPVVGPSGMPYSAYSSAGHAL